AAECRGLVMLEPSRDVSEQREAGAVRLREAVVAKAQDLLKDAVRELVAVSLGAHAALELRLEWLEPAAMLPRCHRAPQLIGFARREIRGDDRELHDLLLEDWHAESSLENVLDFRARVLDLFLAVTSPQIRMHHVALDRPRPDERNFDHEVVVVLRLEP